MSAQQLYLPLGECHGYGCPILHQQGIVERVFSTLSRDLRAEIERTWCMDLFRDVLWEAEDYLDGEEWKPWLYRIAAQRLRRECRQHNFYDFQNRIAQGFAQRFEQLERETSELFELQKQELVRLQFAA
jgi:DNA-directed RNA polymerase specialized sigma24 family protein